MIRSLQLFVVCLLCLAANRGQAEIIISNYDDATNNTSTTIAADNGNFSKAAGFTLPIGYDYALESVVLRLTRNDPNATMQLDLFGDVGGNPGGAPVVSFTIPSFSGTGDVTFTPLSPFTLSAGTTYWLAATGSSPTIDGILWLSTPGGSLSYTGIATSNEFRFDATGVYPPQGYDDYYENTYQVNGTALSAVPAPTSIVLVGMGLGMLGLSSLRPNRRKPSESDDSTI